MGETKYFFAALPPPLQVPLPLVEIEVVVALRRRQGHEGEERTDHDERKLHVSIFSL